MRRSIEFTLNGRPARVEAEEGELLLDVLRGPLALHGARFGCGAGQCGACAVLLDGEAVSACATEIGAAALIARRPDPSRAEIAEALDGHLCRCGVHNRVMDAVALAAQRLRDGRIREGAPA